MSDLKFSFWLLVPSVLAVVFSLTKERKQSKEFSRKLEQYQRRSYRALVDLP